MNNGTVTIIGNMNVIRHSQTACISRILQGALHQNAMQLKNPFWRKMLVFDLSYKFHSLIIIEDHTFAVISRFPPLS